MDDGQVAIKSDAKQQVDPTVEVQLGERKRKLKGAVHRIQWQLVVSLQVANSLPHSSLSNV